MPGMAVTWPPLGRYYRCFGRFVRVWAPAPVQRRRVPWRRRCSPNARSPSLARFFISFPLAVLLLVGLLPLAATAAEGTHSDNLTHVGNLGYAARNGGAANSGTDIEFAELAGREYALAGSYKNGLQIVDITNPEAASIAAVYDC